MVVGICVGETNLNEVTFISNEMPQVGQYVTIEYDGKKVLGMVENLVRGNDAFQEHLCFPERKSISPMRTCSMKYSK